MRMIRDFVVRFQYVQIRSSEKQFTISTLNKTGVKRNLHQSEKWGKKMLCVRFLPKRIPYSINNARPDTKNVTNGRKDGWIDGPTQQRVDSRVYD